MGEEEFVRADPDAVEAFAVREVLHTGKQIRGGVAVITFGAVAHLAASLRRVGVPERVSSDTFYNLHLPARWLFGTGIVMGRYRNRCILCGCIL